MEEESKVLDNYKVIEDCLCIRMPEGGRPSPLRRNL